jgi:putative ABC transport system permease protein
MAVFALVTALAITKLVLPYFNDFTEKHLELTASTDYRIWTGIFITVAVVGLFAGSYPAIFQSGLKPLLLLKNKVQQGKGHLSLRRGLVVFHSLCLLS